MAAPTRLHLRVFLSSPGDVADERNLARRVLKDELPVDPFLRGKVTLDPVSWDDPHAPTPMLANLTPQDAVNRGLPKPSDCDIVVVILWSRMGTPLPAEYRKPSGEPYLSGTEWEYEDALTSTREPKPEILVYRRTEELKIGVTDSKWEEKREQYARVEQFFQRFRNPDGSARGSITKYATPSEFAERLKNDLRALLQPRVAALPAEEPTSPGAGTATEQVAPAWPADRSPYPGLRAFTSAESAIFFGRGREVDRLIAHLRDPARRFLCVVGASGTGKSSLVRAGLLPRVLAGGIEGGEHWRVLTFTPGAARDDPFLALAARLETALPEAGRESLGEIAEALAADPACIAAYAARILADGADGARLVLFADQLEELFTLVAEHHRPGFIDLLAHAAADARLRVLATLRADFFAQATASPPLASLLQSGNFPLAPPDPVALNDMIRRPAECAGLTLEDGLVEAIRRDAGDDPGALPLVAFCLEALYLETLPSHALTLRSYDDLGRLQGAIGRRAADHVARLPAEARDALPRLFQALVHVDADGTPTRRRAPRPDAGHDSALAALAAELVEARLLHAEEAEGCPTVAVAHEALFDGWPQLREWLTDNRVFLLRRAEIEADMARWEREEHHPDFLLPFGKRLDEAVALAKEHSDLLLPGMHEYIKASLEPRRQWSQHDEETLRGASRDLSALSRQQRAAGNIDEALELALKAMPRDMGNPDRPYVPEAEVALYQAFSAAQDRLIFHGCSGEPFRGAESVVLRGHEGPLRFAAFIQESTRVATASADGTARLWDAASGQHIATLEGHPNAVNSIAESPDGTRLVTASADRTAVLWEAVSRERLARLVGHKRGISSAAFGPRHTRITTASDDGTARLWDAVTGELLVTFAGHSGAVMSALFSPDGTRLVTASSDSSIRVWDASSGTELSTLKDKELTSPWRIQVDHFFNTLRPYGFSLIVLATSLVALSDSNIFNLLSVDKFPNDAVDQVVLYYVAFLLTIMILLMPVLLTGLVRFYRLQKAHPAATSELTPIGFVLRTILNANSRDIILLQLQSRADDAPVASALFAVFSPDGHRVLSAYGDGSARLWDGASGRILAKLAGHTYTISSVAFSPPGNCIVTASYDGTARLWDPASGKQLSILRGHGAEVHVAAFSPTGNRVVTASEDGTARLWDTASGECLAIFRGHSARVVAAAFNADGTRIVTGSDDGTARIWRVLSTTQALIDEARRLLPAIQQQQRASQDSVPAAESVA